jgi:hypothetical protein
MNDVVTRTFQEIAARPEGPMAFRFYLQPAMAMFFAVRDGVKDARTARPAYFWSLFTDPEHRSEMARDGWKSVGKIFIMAVAMDLIYQLLVLRGLRPIQTVMVAVLVAIVPYLLLRGPVNRVARRWFPSR